MATTNVSRFYLTDIRVKIASREIEGTRRNYQERVDPIPPPSRPPAPPMPRPPPACPPAKVCPPATATVCPPARATVCPPPITKVPVSEILRNIPYKKAGVSGLNLDISILLPAGTNPTLRFKVADLQSSYPNVFERITGGGGRKHKTKKLRNYKGGQSCMLNPDSKIDSSIYLFRPSTFNLDESSNSVYLPVYFDYYAYLRKNFAYISRVENLMNPLSTITPNNVIMGIDRLLSCSFILDQYNIPYYITRIKVSDTDTYYAIVKKCNPNANYSNTALNNNSFFKLEINFRTDLIMQMVDSVIGFATYDYKDMRSNELNYKTDQIKLQSIPDDIGFPNITNSRAGLVKDLTAPTGLQPPRMALGYELLPGTILPPPAPYPAPSVGLPPASPPR